MIKILMKFIISLAILLFASSVFAEIVSCKMILKNFNGSYAVDHNDTVRMNGNFKHDEFEFEVIYEHTLNNWKIKDFNWSPDIFDQQEKREKEGFKKAIIDGKLNDRNISKALGIKFKGGKTFKSYMAEINKLSKNERIDAWEEIKNNFESYDKTLKSLKNDWSDINFVNYKKNNNSTRMSINEGSSEIISNISHSDGSRSLFAGDLQIKGVNADFYYDFKFKGNCKNIAYVATKPKEEKKEPESKEKKIVKVEEDKNKIVPAASGSGFFISYDGTD